MYYVPKLDKNDKETGLGRCRRRSPLGNGWPVVFETCFCGDHKLDESKIGGVHVR
jgi:hypothetical protein